MNKKYVALISLAFLMIGSASASLGSPSSVEVKSNSQFFKNYNQKVIVMEWTADSLTGTEQVTIQPRNINSRISKGKVTEPVTIQITNSQNTAQYDIRDGGRKDVRQFEYAKNQFNWGKFWSIPSNSERRSDYNDWANSNCDGIQGDYNYYMKEYRTGYFNENVKGTVICGTWGTKVASIGEIESTPDIQMTSTFQLDVGGQTKSVTVGNDVSSSTTKKLGNIARINFEGSLSSGYQFPNPDDELVAHSNSFNDNWRIIQNTETERFGTSYSEYFKWADGKDTTSQLKAILNPKNNIKEKDIENLAEVKSSDVVESYSRSEFTAPNVNINGGSIRDGSIEISGNQRAEYPRYRLFIKADEVGFRILNADPTIQSVYKTTGTIKEGRVGRIKLTVQNTGNGVGSFTAKMSCGKNFRAVDTSTQFTNLKAGQSSTQTLAYTTTASNDQRSYSGSCDITVENNQDTSESVSTSVTVKGKQATECSPDRHFPKIENTDGDKALETVIYECASNGLSESKVKVCDDDKTAERQSRTQFVCKDNSKPPQKEICGNNIDDDQDGKIDENCGGGQEKCGNQVDDDGDGVVDEGCKQPPEKKCLVNVGLGFGQKLQLLCFPPKTYALLNWLVIGISGLIGGTATYRLGRAFTGFGRRPPNGGTGGNQGGNRNNSQMSGRGTVRRRRSPIPLLLGLLGFILGAGVGLWLGFFGALGVIALLIVVEVALPFI